MAERIKEEETMLTKIQITGDILVETGMHIGGSSAFAAIGAVDAPVIKDSRTNLPIIPGSSLKGKMRSLLAKEMNSAVVAPDDDCYELARLFGTAKKGKIMPSRLLFADMSLANEEELRKAGLQSLTEVKFENTINRATAVANPRQIERVVRGSVFKMDVVYNVNSEHEDELIPDMKTFAEGLKLLQFDYLGGNGSRGYGKVVFQNVKAKVVTGSLDEQIINQCNVILAV